jgi:preprotein translocase subunit SecA
MHAQVVTPETEAAEPAVSDMRYTAPEDPSERQGVSAPPADPAVAAAAQGAPVAEEEEVNVPVVKSDWDKTPRNAPCPCGSGKKFKHCHAQ